MEIINEDIYMYHPQGFFTNTYFLCRLNKSLYGLKQAPKAWYAKIDGFLLSLSFVRCKSDPNVYLKLIHASLIIIVLYLDDLIISVDSWEYLAKFLVLQP